MTASTSNRLLGIQLLALALVGAGELAGSTAVVALGVSAFFAALAAVGVATTTSLVDAVRNPTTGRPVAAQTENR